MRPATSSLAVWAGILVLYVVWGSTYLGIRVAIETLPPFLMCALRFIAAGSILSGAVALLNRRALRRPTPVEIRDTAVVAAFLLLGGMGLVAWAEQTVPSGIAALLVALMPMWLAIFARVGFGDRLPTLAGVGIVVGLAGIAILAWPAGGVGDLDPTGLVALVVAPMFWAVGLLFSARRAVLPAPALFATGLQMVAGGVILLAVAAATGELGGFDPAAVSDASWLGLGYLVVMGSLVGFTTFAWLIRVAPLPQMSTYAYVNPVVAVFLGWLLVSEPLTPRTIVAAVVIVVAVVLIVTARGRVSTAPATPPRIEVGVSAPEAAPSR